MKFLNLLTVVILILAAGGGSSLAAECDTPEKVANLFLKYDFEGDRILSDTSPRIYHLETDDMNELGWDECTLVTGYEIKSSREKGSEATITVEFRRAWRTEDTFERQEVNDQTEELHLRKVDGCWQVAPPIYNPHVSAPVLLKHFGNLEDDASKHFDTQSDKEYLIWVRQRISNFEAYRATIRQ